MGFTPTKPDPPVTKTVLIAETFLQLRPGNHAARPAQSASGHYLEGGK